MIKSRQPAAIDAGESKPRSVLPVPSEPAQLRRVVGTIVKTTIRATMSQVNRLTRKEQLVLAMLLGLFIVGWTVKVWRATQEKAAPAVMIEP